MASSPFMLPLFPRRPDGETCTRFAYLTDEEAEVLAAIRRLGEEARAVRAGIGDATARGAE